jgi:very-short-patch-repair endonuclease
VSPANWWNAYGLPTPQKEYRFHPKRRWRFDFAWPTQKIAVEIEGGVWSYGRHTRGSGFLADMDKYNMAGALGWRVFRFTPDQFNKGEVYSFMEKVLNPTKEK